MGAGHSHGERPSPRARARGSCRVLIGARSSAPLVLATARRARRCSGPTATWRSARPGVDVRARHRRGAGGRPVPPARSTGCRARRRSSCSAVPAPPARRRRCCPTAWQAPEVVAGDRIIVSFAEQAPDGEQYAFQDFDRGPPLLVLTDPLRASAVLALSRWRGIGALASLAYSLVAHRRVHAPRDHGGLLAARCRRGHDRGLDHARHALPLARLHRPLDGRDARHAGLARGDRRRSAGCSPRSATSPGCVDEGSQYISGIAAQVDLRGLLLAGLVIGALGVLDDVTVTQTWAVWELADARPRGRPRARSSSARCASVARTPPPPSTPSCWPTSAPRCR